ncbi:MAG: amidohydrolase family protein, partial [Proteobacteria bacterium]|nr:amidohydrolase family protein [Pseudomonadota bacterium]
MTDTLLIKNGVILAMDAGRRVLEGASLLVRDGRIAAIGADVPAMPPETPCIDAAGMVVMPGLIDTHAHAGHMLTKGLGGDSEDWMTITGRVYAEATDAEFWAAEAALSAAERIKCGTTTAALLFGGGPDIMRTEAPDAANAHLAVIAEMGLREVLAIGPNRLSAKSIYRKYNAKSYDEIAVLP